MASLKVLGHIEWRLFCNLFPTFRHMKEEKTCNRSHTPLQHTVVSSIHWLLLL